jgi:hypothetical protein
MAIWSMLLPHQCRSGLLDFWYHAMQILVQLLVVHVETPYDDNDDCQIKGGMDH